jgi:hypothetical protein
VIVTVWPWEPIFHQGIHENRMVCLQQKVSISFFQDADQVEYISVSQDTKVRRDKDARFDGR